MQHAVLRAARQEQVKSRACALMMGARQAAMHLNTVLVPMFMRFRKYLSDVWWYSQSSALKKDAMECDAEMSSCDSRKRLCTRPSGMHGAGMMHVSIARERLGGCSTLLVLQSVSVYSSSMRGMRAPPSVSKYSLPSAHG